MAEEGSLFYLPEALEEEILVRLPVKSIERFESVCKRWCSLFRSKAFSEFYFGSGHHQVSIPTKADLHLIYPELRQRRRRPSFRSATQLIGPLSNGIYALTSVLISPRTSERVFLHTLKIALYNPATRRMKFAPPFPDEYLPLLTGISSHSCRFSCGVDDDYNVVVLINYEGSGNIVRHRLCFLAFLYTWRTGKWERLVDYNKRRKRIGIPSPPATNAFGKALQLMDDMVSCSQKLFDGCWHWMTVEKAERDEVEEVGWWKFVVLTFDFNRKSFGSIPGPRCKATHYSDLFVLHDHLGAIVIANEEFRCEIWMKTRDLETTWTNVYSINVRPTYLSVDILHELDYYKVHESELISIRRLVLVDDYSQLTFDEKGELVAEDERIKTSKQISLSVGGNLKFRPTLQLLP